MNLSLLPRQLKVLNTILVEYEQQFAAQAKTQHNETPVRAVTCYKGSKNFFALPVITKIVD